MKNRKGFTFIETLIVIGIITLLATTVVVVVNPARRFEEARDKQREIHLQTILSAIEQKRTLEGGWFGFGCDPLPQEVEKVDGDEIPIFKTIGNRRNPDNPEEIHPDYYDLYTCLVPIYLAEPLYDPAEGNEEDTRYQIWQNPYSKRVTLFYEKEEKKIVAGPKDYGTLSIPEVETTNVTEVYKEYISHYSAKVGGEVIDDGGAPVWETGVIWAKDDIAEGNLKLELVDMSTIFYKTIGSGEGLFADTITGLTYETQYQVRAYARNDISPGVGYGLKEDFETPDLKPIVTTLPASDVSVDRATLWGEVISCGGDPPFSNCYRYFKLDGQKTDYDYGPKGEFSITITELGIGDYEFWACAAQDREGETERCSEIIETFKTEESVPIVAKPEIVRIGAYDAEIKGIIEHTGGLEVTEYGLCFTAIGRTPVYPGDCKILILSPGEEIMPGDAPYDFNMTIPEEPEKLSPGTDYWVFAFARNIHGRGESRELLEFRTGIEKPILATEPIIQNADHHSAELGGTIAYDGGAPILEHGVCWGTLFDPDYCLFKGEPDEYEFSYRVKNFLIGTNYDIQAFAKNEEGWGFSGIGSFSPIPPAEEPELGETEVVDGSITKTSAEFKGTILNHSGTRILDRGFCWSLYDVAPDPRYPPEEDEGGCIHLGSADILPSGILDDMYEFSAILPEGTLYTDSSYYVNAFAENAAGHGFQVGDVQFTTLPPDPPEVQTYDEPTINGRTAVAGGKLIFDGGDPWTKVGICYVWNIEDDDPEYNKTYEDGGCVEGERNEQGEFYVQLTGLIGGRFYNYRAYANNSRATTYGATYSFQAGLELGATCGADGGDLECKSTNCVDGVCCNSSCGDICEACNMVGSIGTCTPAVGVDPRNDCAQGWSCQAYYSCTIDHYDGECAGKGVCRIDEADTENIPLGYICAEPGTVVPVLEDVYTDQISEEKWCRQEEDKNCGEAGNKCTSIRYLQYFSCAGTGVCRDPETDGFDYNFETGEGLDFGVITENIQATKGEVLNSDCQSVTPSINNFCDRTINCISGQCSAQRWFRGCEADGTQNCTDYNKVLRTPDWPTTANHIISQDEYKIGISCSELLNPCGDCQWCQAGTCKNEFSDLRNTPTNIATIKIGDQCWMAQSMNVGTRVDGTSNQGTSYADIKKYCYGDNSTNCTADNPNYPDGGIYQWSQVMCGSITEGAQGICSNGWHIPTDDEWSTLVSAVGDNPGTKLQPGGTSGFEGNLAGHRRTVGVFAGRGSYAAIWSSTQYTNETAWYRSLYDNDSNVYKLLFDKAGGFSVRCIKN